ncbi:hypothetical protein JW916_14440 [Candidatus Sumerlaeota bacterium]|nr:hypothetical protein [Candidatus Sumerlaeota bacterium]
MVDDNPLSTCIIKEIPSAENLVFLYFAFTDKNHTKCVIHEVDYFSLIADPILVDDPDPDSKYGVPTDYKIWALVPTGPDPDDFEWVEIVSVVGNQQISRAHSFPRVRAAQICLEIIKCVKPGSTIGKRPNFRWISAYNHEVSFFDK